MLGLLLSGKSKSEDFDMSFVVAMSFIFAFLFPRVWIHNYIWDSAVRVYICQGTRVRGFPGPSHTLTAFWNRTAASNPETIEHIKF